MSFGNNIKKLRRDADMTQEKLADLLSVSPQAVSRWETDAAMPDIALLPRIAYLFHVTTDFLLDVDITQKDNQVNEIISRYKEELFKSTDEGQVNALKIIREGLKLFPDNNDLKYRLAECLFISSGDKENRKNNHIEMNKVCEDMMASCSDPMQNWGLIGFMCLYAEETNNLERTKKLAEKMPPMILSREVLLLNCLTGEARKKARKELVYSCVSCLHSALYRFFLRPGEDISSDEIISLYHKTKKIYEILYDDDDYVKIVYFDEYQVARSLARTGDAGKAFSILDEWINKMYRLNDNKYTNFSPLLPDSGAAQVLKNKSCAEWQEEHSRDAIEFIKMMDNDFSDEIKKDPRYDNIKNSLIELSKGA